MTIGEMSKKFNKHFCQNSLYVRTYVFVCVYGKSTRYRVHNITVISVYVYICYCVYLLFLLKTDMSIYVYTYIHVP